MPFSDHVFFAYSVACAVFFSLPGSKWKLLQVVPLRWVSHALINVCNKLHRTQGSKQCGKSWSTCHQCHSWIIATLSNPGFFFMWPFFIFSSSFLDCRRLSYLHLGRLFISTLAGCVQIDLWTLCCACTSVVNLRPFIWMSAAVRAVLGREQMFQQPIFSNLQGLSALVEPVPCYLTNLRTTTTNYGLSWRTWQWRSTERGGVLIGSSNIWTILPKTKEAEFRTRWETPN